MSDERQLLTYEEAVAMLPDSDDIHTFSNGASGMMIGCDWKRDHVLAAIKEHGCELAGGMAAAMNHGLFLRDPSRRLFIGTKPDDQAKATEPAGPTGEGRR